ncbi:MAG: GTP 3',8-cyclase MoaA [Verrucomicrobiales bacterium]|nr:GTP 3',8-cyclase MoaA [Verrucomicrobiales bacterium]
MFTSGIQALPRAVDYLRISITDRCNERCLYCMPEGFKGWQERADILSYEEILRVASVAAGMGFRKFRVTGGEPLVRKDVPGFVKRLSAIPGVRATGMTTNGTRLAPVADELRQAGLRAINISLDALTPAVYRRITGGEIEPVLEGIKAAAAAGFECVKINMVLIRGMNEDEIWPIVHFAAEHRLVLRFIELMPVSLTEMLNEKNFLPVGDVQRTLSSRDRLLPLEKARLGHGPARYFRLEKTGVTVGFIGAITNLHFCEACNKVRLTSDGKIRPCLGNHGEFDLKPALRGGGSDEDLAGIFAKALDEKPLEHLFRNNYRPDRIMTAIGG